MKVACIVEGHGEQEAVPLLVRRIAQEVHIYPDVLRPMRVPASQLRKAGELERALEFAARKCGDGGAILIMLDADDDCPAELGPALLVRSLNSRPDNGACASTHRIASNTRSGASQFRKWPFSGTHRLRAWGISSPIRWACQDGMVLSASPQRTTQGTAISLTLP